MIILCMDGLGLSEVLDDDAMFYYFIIDLGILKL